MVTTELQRQPPEMNVWVRRPEGKLEQTVSKSALKTQQGLTQVEPTDRGSLVRLKVHAGIQGRRSAGARVTG